MRLGMSGEVAGLGIEIMGYLGMSEYFEVIGIMLAL